MHVFSHTTDSLWIGGNDIDIEGQYAWDTGEPVSWTDWGPEEPKGGVNDNDCINFRRLSNGNSEWRDRTCGALNRFVCEGIQLFI